MANESMPVEDVPFALPIFDRVLLNEWIKRTKVRGQNWQINSFNCRQREEAAINSNSNGNSETKDVCGGGTPWSGCDIRNVVVFASKQIFERGFEKLNLCYFDFGFNVFAVVALADLFKDVDADKDGRLGINDIYLWLSGHGEALDSKAAADVIKNLKGESGGFLSKLDFVCLILEREMAAKDEKAFVAADDLLWATFIAMDANRDGWISVEDFHRLCRPLNYHLCEEEEKAISCCGGGGLKGGENGNLNFRDFKRFVEKLKTGKGRKSKPCLIQ